MKTSNPTMHILSLILLLVIVGAFLIFHFLQGPLPLWPPPITNHQSSISALWIQHNVYINPDDQAQLIAVAGKLIFIGSVAIDHPGRLIAFDDRSGNMIWQFGDTDEGVLAASPTNVFVGEVGKVTSLNPDNGEIVWSTQLPFTRSVTKLLVRDNVLYVDTVSENHFLLEIETGKILQTISYASSNVPAWSDHIRDLEFADSIMYFQKEDPVSNKVIEITALSELDGNQLWSSNVSAVSKITANSLGVYVLTTDGKLLKFNPLNGSSDELIQFIPTFTQQHYSEGGTARDYGYHVTVDEKNQLMFVYLGDSAQLFAYRLPISP
jgi:outer membrane protein assembly factor BamB